jgi:hypothetical protein
MTIADIIDKEGAHCCKEATTIGESKPIQSINTPGIIQHKPDFTSWRIWNHFIHMITLKKHHQLKTELGRWTVNRSHIRKSYKCFRTKKKIYYVENETINYWEESIFYP